METKMKMLIVTVIALVLQNCSNLQVPTEEPPRVQQNIDGARHYYDFGMFTKFETTVIHADSADTIYLVVEKIKYISLQSNNPIPDRTIENFQNLHLKNIVDE